MILSVLFFSLMDVLIKITDEYDVGQVMFSRALFGLIPIFFLIPKEKLKNFYKDHFFIKIKPINKFISTNDVINTNFCHISVCKSKFKNKIVILSVIDNLIKGGAGQAVQNINNYYGFDIKKGLIWKM